MSSQNKQEQGAARATLSIVILLTIVALMGLLLVTAPASTACSGAPATPGGTGTGSPSPSSTGGGLPTLPPLPGSSPSPSPTPSSSPTGGVSKTCQAEITIGYSASTDLFKGRVKSDESACVAKRDVKVKKAKKGPDKTVGQALSSKGGQWKVKVPNAKGRYYASAKKLAAADEDGNPVTCAAAKSKTIKV